jgi:lipid A 4'-phosphatase
VAFGRHFVSDVVVAGLITIFIIFALYRLLLAPARRNDARLELGIERASRAIHRGIGAVLGSVGEVLARAGTSLRSTGQHLHKRVACL